MKIGANDIRKGYVIKYKSQWWVVTATSHVQPGKGGAYMQVELKNIENQKKDHARFRSSETVERAHLDQAACTFMYTDATHIYVMDKQTFETIIMDKEVVPAQQLPFLHPDLTLTLSSYNNKPTLLSLPETAICTIVECEPSVKNQTATGSYKPAVLDNGVKIGVPQFVEQGQKIVVNLTTMEYLKKSD